jgi:hypothetical protein
MKGTSSNNSVSNLFPLLNKLSTRTFFLGIFALQVILIFQGLDLSDEGFLSIFYKRVFSDPVSVSYNFMFWLTGIIGGVWEKISSPLGLLGIRLGGAVVNTLTVILTYNLLRKYLNSANLKLGLLLVVLSLNNDIKVLNYNSLSSLFYIIAIYFLFSGLQKEQPGKILLGGLFIGLNVFIRTPNILQLGVVLGIAYHTCLTNKTGNKFIRQVFVFLAGFLLAIVSILLVMFLAGHLQIYLDSIKLLYSMGKGYSGNQVDQGGYGLSRLLYIFRSNNIQSVKYALIAAGLVLGSLFLINKAGRPSKFKDAVIKIITTAGIALALFLIFNHSIDHFTELFLLTGIILLTAVAMITSSVGIESKLLLFFGCFFLLSFPLGSSDGIYTAGRYCLWIALPVTLDYLLSIQSLDNAFVSRRHNQELNTRLWISEKQLMITKRLVTGLAVFAGFYYVYCYPFFDRRNRLLMHYSLKSNNLKGVYTTKGRAETFNELLVESAKYIKPDDYVIAYDHIAMFYYATNTIPYTSNSLPSVYSAKMFASDLAVSLNRHKKLPVVVMQTISTTGAASKWPEEILPLDYFKNEQSQNRDLILNAFLIKNHYRKVWENKAFKILLPGNSDISEY